MMFFLMNKSVKTNHIHVVGGSLDSAASGVEEGDVQVDGDVPMRGYGRRPAEGGRGISGDSRICHEGVHQQDDCSG